MYRAYHTLMLGGMPSGPYLFFDALLQSPQYQIMEPTLQGVFGKAGTFSFKVPLDNNQYDQFVELISYIDLYREKDLIFSGRILSLSKGFDNVYNVVCEGCLAIFNDTLALAQDGTPAIAVVDGTAGTSGSVAGWMRKVINLHNYNYRDPNNNGKLKATDGYKAFELGHVYADKINDIYYVTFSEYSTIMSVLEAFSDKYGGYFQATKEGDVFKLSYYQNHNTLALLDFPEMGNPNQVIDFGRNLLDLTQETNTDSLATVVIAEGAVINPQLDPDTRYKVTVSNQDLLDKFGTIVRHVCFDEIEDLNTLKKIANQYLKEVSAPTVTINASAIDLAKAGSDINHFQVGQLVRVRSKIHGLDEELVVQSYDLNILDPTSSQITLGNEKLGFVSRSKKSERNIYNEINNVRNKVLS